MTIIDFTAQERAALVARLRDWFRDETDHDLGGFEAEFLLDFVAAELGVHFYNRGVQDARIVVAERVEVIADALFEIEKAPPRQ